MQKKYLKNNFHAFAFVVLLFTIEIVVGAANKVRSDAFSFLMMSASLVCALSSRWLLSTVLLCIGIENHPITAVGAFYNVAVFLSEYNVYKASARLSRNAWHCIFGLVIGVGVYFSLHQHSPGVIVKYLADAATGYPYKNIFVAHYLSARYHRFVLEIPYLVIGLSLFIGYWRKGKNSDPGLNRLFLLLLAMGVATIVFQRGNPYYVVFIYCVAFLISFAGFAHSNYAKPAFAVMLLVNIMFASTRIYVNWNVDHEAFYEKLDVVSKDMDPSIPIFGPSGGWFNFKEGYFIYRTGFMKYAQPGPYAYVIDSCCNEEAPPACIGAIPVQFIGSFLYNGSRVTVSLHENQCANSLQSLNVAFDAAPSGPSREAR